MHDRAKPTTNLFVGVGRVRDKRDWTSQNKDAVGALSKCHPHTLVAQAVLFNI
jgi:hypothetical protein